MEFNPGFQALNTSCTAYSEKEQEGEKITPIAWKKLTP